MTENLVKDIIAIVLIKAWEDNSFKEELLASPINTIEKLTGERISFKVGLKMSIAGPTKSESLDFIMPPYVVIDDMELSEQELEFVAGGSTIDIKSQEDFITFLEPYL